MEPQIQARVFPFHTASNINQSTFTLVEHREDFISTNSSPGHDRLLPDTTLGANIRDFFINSPISFPGHNILFIDTTLGAHRRKMLFTFFDSLISSPGHDVLLLDMTVGSRSEEIVS